MPLVGPFVDGTFLGTAWDVSSVATDRTVLVDPYRRSANRPNSPKQRHLSPSDVTVGAPAGARSAGACRSTCFWGPAFGGFEAWIWPNGRGDSTVPYRRGSSCQGSCTAWHCRVSLRPSVPDMSSSNRLCSAVCPPERQVPKRAQLAPPNPESMPINPFLSSPVHNSGCADC